MHWLPLLTGTVDFRRGNRFLPLKKGGQEGFWNGSFGQIPLDPPFSKGEGNTTPPRLDLSTVPTGGGCRDAGRADAWVLSARPLYFRDAHRGLAALVGLAHGAFVRLQPALLTGLTKTLIQRPHRFGTPRSSAKAQVIGEETC